MTTNEDKIKLLELKVQLLEQKLALLEAKQNVPFYQSHPYWTNPAIPQYPQYLPVWC